MNEMRKLIESVQTLEESIFDEVSFTEKDVRKMLLLLKSNRPVTPEARKLAFAMMSFLLTTALEFDFAEEDNRFADSTWSESKESELDEAPIKKKGHFKAKAVPPKGYNAANDELLNLSEVMLELFYDATLPSEVERKFQDFHEALIRAIDGNEE